MKSETLQIRSRWKRKQIFLLMSAPYSFSFPRVLKSLILSKTAALTNLLITGHRIVLCWSLWRNWSHILLSSTSLSLSVAERLCSRWADDAFALFSPAMNSFADVSKFLLIDRSTLNSSYIRLRPLWVYAGWLCAGWNKEGFGLLDIRLSAELELFSIRLGRKYHCDQPFPVSLFIEVKKGLFANVQSGL